MRTFLKRFAIGVGFIGVIAAGQANTQEAAAPIPVPMGTWNSNETTALKFLLGEVIKLRGREVSKTADYLIDRVEAQEKAAVEAAKAPPVPPAAETPSSGPAAKPAATRVSPKK